MSTRITPILLLLVASTPLLGQSAEGDAKLSLRDRNFLKDFGPDFPVGEDPDPRLEVELRLRRNPEDAWAIRKATDELQLDNERMVNIVAERHYFDGFDRMQKEMLAPLDQVEKSLEDHESMLDALPAKSAAARAAIKWGRTYIERERVMLEVYRTSRADSRNRVLSDPLNGMEAAKFFQRVIFESSIFRETSPERISGLIADGKAVVEAIRGRSTEIKKTAYEPAWLSPLKQVERLTQLIEQQERQLARFREDQKRFAESSGKQFEFPNVTAWANGSPVSAADTAGKITLLLHSNVRNSKCERVLPDLRQICVDYVETDLIESFCLTHYQGLGWDNEKNSFVRDLQTVTRLQEQEAITSYCNLVNVSLPFAILTMKDFGKAIQNYKFSELPVVVIIDQAGKIRLVRTWRSRAETDEIRQTIEKLLN